MQRFAEISRELSQLTGARCAPSPVRQLHGGSINDCYRWAGARDEMFVKLAPRASHAMFEAEAEGLAALARAAAVRVPRVLACGHTEGAAFLALEWIEAGPRTPDSERRLGAALAALHAVTGSAFGWHRDNTLGPTPQANVECADWSEFFRDRRLRPQLELAVSNGFGSLLEEPGRRLLEAVPALLAGHRPAPSLLHGDLWGGNWLTASSGEPVIFDPAVYYGDREADLAMTQLFGGFGSSFYQAYQVAASAAPGAPVRVELYNLYHLLNHANLFGGGYAGQARRVVDGLLAEARA